MMLLPGPSGCTLLHRLKPRMQGILSSRMPIRLTATAFLRLQPQRSMPKVMIFSNTAMTVDRAAKVRNTKNRVPHRRPSAISLKMLGRVTKIRLGPESGRTPKEKQAGEDDKAAHQCHEGVQHADAYRLTGQPVLFADVATENGQRTDAEGEGEECLSHGGVDRLPQHKIAVGIVHQIVQVGLQVEFQTLRRAGGVSARTTSTTSTASRQIIMTGDLLHAILKPQ